MPWLTAALTTRPRPQTLKPEIKIGPCPCKRCSALFSEYGESAQCESTVIGGRLGMPVTTVQKTLGKKTKLGFWAPRASGVTIEKLWAEVRPGATTNEHGRKFKSHRGHWKRLLGTNRAVWTSSHQGWCRQH